MEFKCCGKLFVSLIFESRSRYTNLKKFILLVGTLNPCLPVYNAIINQSVSHSDSPAADYGQYLNERHRGSRLRKTERSNRAKPVTMTGELTLPEGISSNPASKHVRYT